jgi:hypothetical protein
MIIAIITVASMIAEVVGPNAGQFGQDATQNITTPFNVSGGNFNQTTLTYNATLQLVPGSMPMDIEMLNVSIKVNGKITGTKIWRYSNSSCIWASASHQGTMLGSGDRAKIIVNLKSYGLNNGDKVEMLLQMPESAPAVSSFIVNRSISTPIAKGNDSTMANHTSAGIISGKVTVSGHVYINNNSAPATAVTFLGENVSRSIVADYSGYYIIALDANMPYTVTVKDRDLGTLMDEKSPSVFSSNSTLDIMLYTRRTF